MANVIDGCAKGKRIDIGIDAQKNSWSACILCEGEEIYQAILPPDVGRLISLVRRLEPREVHTVYEAGPTGFGLHDALVHAGIDSMVTPPSLVPHLGGRVKTDRRDSRKLAAMLANGFLRRVHVLNQEERADRQLLRSRNQIDLDRRGVMGDVPDQIPPSLSRLSAARERARTMGTGIHRLAGDAHPTLRDTHLRAPCTARSLPTSGRSSKVAHQASPAPCPLSTLR